MNCISLENVEIKCDSTYVCFDAAARMVQNLPHLRCFTFTHGAGNCNPQLLSAPLVLALAQHCPLLETLNLGEYDDGLAQLVAGCPRLHTITIDSAYVSIEGCRALGTCRTITTLHLNTWFADCSGELLAAMADEGMPLKTIHLYAELLWGLEIYNAPRLGNGQVSIIARFASTLENLTLSDLLITAQMTDAGLAVLQQCHQLRSIHIKELREVAALGCNA